MDDAAATRNPLLPARVWFVVGASLATFGFVLPWFRISRSYLWWYGGWELITSQDSVWAGLHLAVALALALGGYWLLRLGPETAVCALATVLTSALSALGLFSLAAAAAVDAEGRIFRLDWNVGLVLLFPGHGIMLAATCVTLMLQLSALHRPDSQ